MRIHSKFQDYYDSALGYGIDEQCHYKRETVEHPAVQYHKLPNPVPSAIDPIINNPFYNELLETADVGFNGWGARRDSNFEYIDSHVFFFCGKIYVGLHIHLKYTAYKNSKNSSHWAYSYDDVERIMKKWGSKADIKEWKEKDEKRPTWWGISTFLHTRTDIKRLFEYNGTERKDLIDLHHDMEIPVMVVSQKKNDGWRCAGLTFNPMLKDYDFYKVVDAWQAFQEISMFISGVLGGNSPKMIEISDEVRIAKHGFNDLSFRKQKEKKK